MRFSRNVINKKISCSTFSFNLMKQLNCFCHLYLNIGTFELMNISRHKNVEIAKRNVKVVDNLGFKIKSPLNKLEKSNTVSKIPCNKCNKIYIGVSVGH